MRMIRPDFYAVLGVAPAASAEEIRQAYYQLARQHHPDAGASDADAERFKIINEAYRVLSTPQLRVAYDNALLMMGQHQANQTSQSGRARPVDSAPLTRTQTTAPVMPSVFPSLGLQVTLGQQRILPLREMTRCYLLTELGPLSEPSLTHSRWTWRCWWIVPVRCEARRFSKRYALSNPSSINCTWMTCSPLSSSMTSPK